MLGLLDALGVVKVIRDEEKNIFRKKWHNSSINW